ncbi:MAG TPA: multiheme c-type cytochrome [candidate division Zixibacteria bacterium]|nr:multiheme c-type cytochrome [candidate division Zixibacteria bacterium]
MRKLGILGILLALACLMLTGMVFSEEAKQAEKKETPKHEYVGAGKCKLCHKAQYESWAETGHAKAFEKLSAEDQKKPECVKCHMTGVMADGTVINNVECEACHGPGSDFKSPKIMNKSKWAADPETYKGMAIEAGLIYPKEENCVRCHTKEGNPHFVPFDFAKRKTQVHVMNTEEGK